MDVQGNLLEVLTTDGRFTTLLAAIDALGIASVFERDVLVTVFAPTDDAFAALENAAPGTLERLLEDRSQLLAILLYHMTAGRLLSPAVLNADTLLSLEGSDITVNINEGQVSLDDAALVEADIEATNGVVHAIASVLTPPEAEPLELVNLIETLRAAGNFQTLLQILETLEYIEALSGEAGTFTLLAPTDAAFAALEAANPGILVNLLNDPTTLTTIVDHHVMAGSYFYASVVFNPTLLTFRPADLSIRTGDDGSVTVDGALISESDVLATNGIVHVLDSVIPAPADHPIGTCANPAEIDGFGFWHGTTSSGFATQLATCGEEAGSKEQIFSWQAAGDGPICVSTGGSRYDTVLHARQGQCASRRAEIACNDDRDEAANIRSSRFELDVVAGEAYFLIVDGYSDDSEGGYILQIREGACP